MANYFNLKTSLEIAEQSHLLKYWDDLGKEQKDSFLVHLSEINFEVANEMFRDAMASLKAEESGAKLDSRMEPVPASHFESEEASSKEKLEAYRKIGLSEIAQGHVAILLMAGGQGTRLGINYPKGMYSVGLPSGKTLFQIQAERIKKLEELAGQRDSIIWYIMTSGPTEEATTTYLRTHNYFGLKKENVVQFDQGVLPCFDLNGRILLEEKDKVALAPDGNGGTYRALLEKGILDDMEKRDVRYIHVHGVDNILIKVADPVFMGYCISKQADCAAKVVKKSSPFEAVGVVCRVDGRFHVVEYSEISPATAQLKDKKGELVFNAGSICNHFFTLPFLNEVALKKLKLHVAKKKIPYIDESGAKIQPKAPNGIKVEKFIFDVFEFSNNFVTWDVPRSSDFSALKNSDDVGEECPSTARADLYRLHKTYVEAAGGSVTGDIVEISPLLSYSGEGLKNLVNGKVFQSPLLLHH